jgi:hypothetical protein
MWVVAQIYTGNWTEYVLLENYINQAVQKSCDSALKQRNIFSLI